MLRNDFDANVNELKAAVVGAMETHFKERRFTFDVGRFLAETQVDLDLFLREAYFLGAEVFPIQSPQQ
ncbi:hypothetical protein SAMN05216358_0079 [Rhizobium sp. AN5]|uniref:hypothetical protein n=1 Tax=Rhizobium sp. AN5 TaxID=1855304 RepID=UPI000BD3BD69|nr:hypothetical protein [Rhizobium sp. AN5]SOC90060.1 hypothetical protein SAMN05216358_0079 [Rhizobium sp. AN5]